VPRAACSDQYIRDLLSRNIAPSVKIILYLTTGITAGMSFCRPKYSKLAKPEVAELKRFWRGLCEWTHAGPGWGQALIGYENVKHRVALSYTPLFMVLDCNFHLLNRQLANSSVVYLIDRYKDGEQFRTTREAAKGCIREVRSNLQRNSLRLVKDFAATWQIKIAAS
jgi:hypothetical protein